MEACTRTRRILGSQRQQREHKPLFPQSSPINSWCVMVDWLPSTRSHGWGSLFDLGKGLGLELQWQDSVTLALLSSSQRGMREGSLVKADCQQVDGRLGECRHKAGDGTTLTPLQGQWRRQWLVPTITNFYTQHHSGRGLSLVFQFEQRHTLPGVWLLTTNSRKGAMNPK